MDPTKFNCNIIANIRLDTCSFRNWRAYWNPKTYVQIIAYWCYCYSYPEAKTFIVKDGYIPSRCETDIPDSPTTTWSPY